MSIDKVTIKPKLVSVHTDMLNINLPIRNNRDKSTIQHNIQDIANEYGIVPFYKYGYRSTIPLLQKEQSKTILFCTNHKYQNRSYIHLQLNPSELTKELTTLLRSDLDYILPGYLYVNLCYNSNVTRMDIAADFKNIKVDDFVFTNARQRISGMYFDQYGKTKTVYLGDNKCNIQIIIYDKTAKKRSLGHSTEEVQKTRIEIKTTPNCPLKDITKIGNPFKGLKVYKLSHLIADNRLPLSFCDSLKIRGLTATLRQLDKNDRKYVEALLSEYAYKGFPTDEIFTQWKKSVNVLNPLAVGRLKPTKTL